MNKNNAIIVGGGLAGLTAGYYLRKAGWAVGVVEASGCVGGRVATVRREGYVLDSGATQLSTGYGEYLALSEELGMRSNISDSSSHVGIIRHGRIHTIDGRHLLKAPFTRLLSLPGKWALLRTIRDYLCLRPAVDPRDVSRNFEVDTESTADYAMRRVGREVYESLMDPLVRAYVMNRGSNVSVLEWFSTLRILSGQTMVSMNAGNDAMPRALADKLKVRVNTRATAIRREGGEVLVETEGAGGKTILRAGACVLATRLPEAIALYPPVRAIAGRLGEIARYNRGLVLHLGYLRRPANPAVGLLLGAAEHNEIGLIWLEHNKNADRAPPGHGLFTVYFDEAVADTCYGLPDADLVSIGSHYLEKLFPELAGYRDFTHVTRWPLGILNPAPGVYREVHAMKSRLDANDPVQLAGDYFTCVGQNSAVTYGKVAAERLLSQAGTPR